MKSVPPLLTALLVATLLAQPVATQQLQRELAAAKTLYAAAAYEEALEALSSIDREDEGQVEQYRALCLLALGRADEAMQAFERLVAKQPRYTIADVDFSPRVVTMFHAARTRMLPAAVKDMYTKARTSFENKQYTAASTQLKDMFTILKDADMPEDAEGLADLKLLGEGFLALAEAKLATASQTAAPTSPASPAEQGSVPPTSPSQASGAPRIYSAADKGVTPPVEIERRMPPWTPQSVADRTIPHRGIVGIVIDEKGAVESVAIQKSVLASYDAPLADAAKAWRFKPATLNGKSVKFWISYEILLRPQ